MKKLKKKEKQKTNTAIVKKTALPRASILSIFLPFKYMYICNIFKKIRFLIRFYEITPESLLLFRVKKVKTNISHVTKEPRHLHEFSLNLRSLHICYSSAVCIVLWLYQSL